MSIQDRHSLVRQINEQTVLEVIFRDGPISRPEVATTSGLSKPTVSALVRDLEEQGLVRVNGKDNGRLGRSPLLYEVDATAGNVFGVDLGGTKVRVGMTDLFGELVAERTEPTVRSDGAGVVDQIRRMSQEIAATQGFDWQAVSDVGLSCPGVFDATSRTVDLAFNIPGLSGFPLVEALESALGAHIIIENDVKLAAVGEKWRGLAKRCENFVFLSVGTGVGMGIVIGGELYRGFRGAAGEIAYLPIGPDAFDPSTRRRGSLEEAAGASGMERALHRRLAEGHKTLLGTTSSVVDIFSAAAEGDPLARDVVDREARHLALGILGVASVLDPEMVVLGGGIGSNPMLLDPIRAHVEELVPMPLRIETSALVDRASLYGAIMASLRATRKRLFNGTKGQVS